MSQWQLKYWMCLTAIKTKNDTVPHLRGSLVKAIYEKRSFPASHDISQNPLL